MILSNFGLWIHLCIPLFPTCTQVFTESAMIRTYDTSITDSRNKKPFQLNANRLLADGMGNRVEKS